MFNDIAPSYDFLNRMLSLRIDELWRKHLIKTISAVKPEIILDVATGTGDIAIRAAKEIKCQQIIGIDISEGMLEIAKEKARKKKLAEKINFIAGDAENIPFDKQKFDCVTCAFGVRNFENLEIGLKEINRVLKPGGMVAILEFTLPKNFIIKALYLFYFKKILPLIGKIVSKNKTAYTYLTKTVEQFPHNQKFIIELENQGFTNCSYIKKTFGIVAIYYGYKK